MSATRHEMYVYVIIFDSDLLVFLYIASEEFIDEFLFCVIFSQSGKIYLSASVCACE